LSFLKGISQGFRELSKRQFLTDKEVIAALDKLPEHYRSVVLLADVQDFDYKEVAEILQIPIGNVMSRLNRAKIQHKKSLANVAVGYGIKKAKLADRIC
jgi:RNA polymerase sigma-70 factor, ECF subfamily